MGNKMESKMMTMEQMDQVAGGHQEEIDVLGEAFGISTDSKTRWGAKKDAEKIAKRLNDEFGITAVMHGGHDTYFGDQEKNYYLNKKTGKSMTHLEVMKLVRQKYPRK